MRLPEFLESYQGEIRKILAKYFERGSILLRFYWEEREPLSKGVRVDRERARAYLLLLKGLKRDFRLKGEMNLSLLTRLEGIFVTDSSTNLKGWSVAKKLVREAATRLMVMREKEGKAVERFLRNGVERVENSLRKIEKWGGMRVKEKRKRIEEKLDGLMEDRDNLRIEQEILLFSERFDIEEEINRLKSHLAFFHQTIDGKGNERRSPRIGRRIDFLLQEMNREVNTLASKAQDAKISLETVKIKEELERIREQVQNLE